MNEILKREIKFSNNKSIPQVGLGTYELTDENETVESIKAALAYGYRHIDTADIYHNHKIIAQAIKLSGVPRSEIFITSKIWNEDHAYEKAKLAIDRILSELELEYIDLLLVHWPTQNRLECWKALEEAVDAKKVVSIGISNFLPRHIEELMQAARIKPVINQFELHPALQNLDIVRSCQKHNIVVESWGTLIRGKCFDFEQIQSLSKKYNKTAPQICLRWAYQNNYVIIPKSSKPSRVIENVQIDDFVLTDTDMQLLSTIEEYRDGPDPEKYV